MLTVSQSQGDFELLPAGQYTARCFKVIDLGTQIVEWQGEEKHQPKIIVTWEILDDEVKMEDGRPFAITKQYTASLNENSHLYKDLVAWRGKPFSREELLGFDISKLLGAYCQVQVVHNESGGRTYANVNAIMGTKDRPKPVNEDVMFDISNPNMELFESFSDWLKDKIRSSQEWQAHETMVKKDLTSRGAQAPLLTGDKKEKKTDNSIKMEDVKIEDTPITIEDVESVDDIDPKDIPF